MSCPSQDLDPGHPTQSPAHWPLDHSCLTMVLFCPVPSHTLGMFSWGNVCANRGQVEKSLKIKACKHTTPTLLWELTTCRSGYGVSEGHPLRAGTLVNFKCCTTFSYLFQEFIFAWPTTKPLHPISSIYFLLTLLFTFPWYWQGEFV